MFNIRMGIPEMEEAWSRLVDGHRNGTNDKKEEGLYRKWGNALKKLASDPLYPSLHSEYTFFGIT